MSLATSINMVALQTSTLPVHSLVGANPERGFFPETSHVDYNAR